jgi:hypothetical protein
LTKFILATIPIDLGRKVFTTSEEVSTLAENTVMGFYNEWEIVIGYDPFRKD